MDQNGRQTLTALSSADDGTIVQLWADPTLHALLTTGESSFADCETPTGAINDVNVTFTLAHTPSPATSLQLTLNGQMLYPVGDDYTLSTATITMNIAPVEGSKLRAWYRY